ncbi:Predicted nucleoside-diphosphate sugar epimerase [Marinomonas sp. MED121]|uniref:polysaccharide biosynthesis protein n=1 Tax=Marinomonas sp. MED121 TaxID=314277 RepID=UPI00006900AD|nr:nucleoside-diphosphate sugar epimerase/dehydratase [Marinomonas sp. MED121]EAQ65685.1 Predicted nucleoside-diphosphate sugar epimerase [Marinomonas sp. MED121]
MKILDKISRLPRYYKIFISLTADGSFIIFAFFLAYWARLGSISAFSNATVWYVIFGTIVLTLLANYKLGVYRAVLRYLTFHAFAVILYGVIISSLSSVFLAYYFNAYLPRTVPIIYVPFLVMLCGGGRFVARFLLVRKNKQDNQEVLIYGAGATGRQLALALKQASNYKVRGFVDEEPSLENTIIQGIHVYGVHKVSFLVNKFSVNKVLLAIPQAPRSVRKTVINNLLKYPVEVLTVPAFSDIITGKAKVNELQDVAISDLLGRDAIAPKADLMKVNITSKVVMVTGAGGSIGSELCRQIVLLKPKILILFDVSEHSLYSIDKELSQKIENHNCKIQIVPLLGSVQNVSNLTTIMNTFAVHTVYHAAAYKHVPLVEYNIVEGVRNNVFGTYCCAKASINAGVESFVLISTDKAVRPTNIMGASKRLAEMILQALSNEESNKKSRTVFCIVRFGNVLGSSGSVIPLFKRQIANNQPITITHPEIIRYFMTVSEAAQLVIQAGALAENGEVFVLDMGEPVKIVDLAKNLIRLSGLEVKSDSNPNGDIELNYTGLRPGEKLFEELLIGNNVQNTIHPRIMTANEDFLTLLELNEIIDELDVACENFDYEKVRLTLINAPILFKPSDSIVDFLWKFDNDKKSLNIPSLIR